MNSNTVLNRDQYAGLGSPVSTIDVTTSTAIVSGDSQFESKPSIANYHYQNVRVVNSYQQQQIPFPVTDYLRQNQLQPNTVSSHQQPPPRMIENYIMPVSSYSVIFDISDAYNPNKSVNPDQSSTAFTAIQNTAPLMSPNENKRLQTIAKKIIKKKFDKKRQRTIYSSMQILLLEKSFAENNYSNRTKRVNLAHKLKLTERQVKVWYQNKRMKDKKSKVKKGRSATVATSTSTGSTQRGVVQSRVTPSSPPVHHKPQRQRAQQQQQAQQQKPAQQQKQAQQQKLPQQQEQTQPQQFQQQRQTQQQLAEHLRPGPSTTVHHYPSVTNVAEDRFNAFVVPQPVQSYWLHHRQQQPPPSSGRLHPVQHRPPPHRPKLPTYEEAINRHST